MKNSDSGAGILVRTVKESDFQEWRELWLGYNQFYGRHGATALPENTTLTTWSRFFDAYEPMHALVAVKDEKLVGLAHFLYHRSTIQVGPSCYLQDLFTAPSVRGQGVARSLIERVYVEAAAAGSPRVYWQTHETNTTAMRLYDKIAERSGFIVFRKQL